jgi:TorA maturation chaperone TorD
MSSAVNMEVNSATTSTVQLSKTVAKHLLSDEDSARANWYAWFASIWLNGPTQEQIANWHAGLVAQSADGGHDDTELGLAWRNVVISAHDLGAAAIQAEYDTLFLSVGKPEVFANASFHLAGFLHEKPLVEIRQRMQELGLGRFDMALTEDHLGLLCTSMRELIQVNSDGQAQFLQDFIASWASSFAEAIDASIRANFYKSVVALWQAFLAVELQSFDFE